MVKILLDHTSLSQADLKLRLEYITKKMLNNVTYSALQPAVIPLDALAAPYAEALFVATEGGDIEPKNKLKAEICLLMTKLAKKVEVVANDIADADEALAFAKGTGLTVRENTAKKVATFLEVPKDFYVADDKKRKGACLLTWEPVVGALTYLIYELDKDGNWQSRGVSKKTSLLMEGTEYEVKKTFRICAAGAGTLVSDYTEPMSVWVH